MIRTGAAEGPELATLVAVEGHRSLLDDAAEPDLDRRLDEALRDLLASRDGREIDKCGRFLLLFERPIDAVAFALAAHGAAADVTGEPLAVRIGIHLGEVRLRENPHHHVARGAKPLELEGPARRTVGRVLSLAGGGQTLLTEGAWRLARRAWPADDGREITWVEHGTYRFEADGECLEVYEVGVVGEAPLTAPEGFQEERRSERQREPERLRPTVGERLPGHGHWVLTHCLEVTDGVETWIAEHAKTGDRRRVALAMDREGRERLARRLAVHQRLAHCGARTPALVEWSLEGAPFRLETVPPAGQPLAAWLTAQGEASAGVALVASLAETVAACHACGVTLGEAAFEELVVEGDGQRAALAVVELKDARELPEEDDGGTAEAWCRSDVAALGRVLFRVAAADATAVPGPFWERRVEDPLLAEEIATLIDPDGEPVSAAGLARRLRGLEARRQERREAEVARRRAAARKSRRRRLLTALLVVLTLLALGLAVVAELGRRRAIERLEGAPVGAPTGTRSPGHTGPQPPPPSTKASSSRLMRRSTFLSGTSGASSRRVGAKFRMAWTPASMRAS